MYFAAFRVESGFGEFYFISIAIEIIFALDLLLCFWKAYIPPNSMTPVSEFSLVFDNYVRTGLIRDLIPLIPL